MIVIVGKPDFYRSFVLEQTALDDHRLYDRAFECSCICFYLLMSEDADTKWVSFSVVKIFQADHIAFARMGHVQCTDIIKRADNIVNILRGVEFLSVARLGSLHLRIEKSVVIPRIVAFADMLLEKPGKNAIHIHIGLVHVAHLENQIESGRRRSFNSRLESLAAIYVTIIRYRHYRLTCRDKSIRNIER